MIGLQSLRHGYFSPPEDHKLEFQETGVVRYWDTSSGWGKIKRMDIGVSLNALGVARTRQIFVHNLQLPTLDAPTRWLRRGDAVRLTVGVTLALQGAQATAMVGVGSDGETIAPLSYQ